MAAPRRAAAPLLLALVGSLAGGASSAAEPLGSLSAARQRYFEGEAEADDPICLLQRDSALIQSAARPGRASDPVDADAVREEVERALGTPAPSTAPPATTPAAKEGEAAPGDGGASTVAASLAFLGAVMLALLFFYLINFPDEDIHRAGWNFLSSCVSVFSALEAFQVYRAALGLMWHRLGLDYEDEPAEPGRTALILHFAQLLAVYALLYGSLYAARGRHSALLAVGTFGAHVLGFSAIDAYGALQRLALFSEVPRNSAFAALIAAGAMLGCSLVHAYVRDSLVAQGFEHWKRQCCVSEIDATGLALGYLVSQAVTLAITGRFASSVTKVGWRDAWLIFAAAVGFGAAAVPASACLQALVRMGSSGYLRRAVQVVTSILAMAMGWCLVFWGTWLLCGGASGDAAMPSRIFFLLAFAAGGIVVVFLANSIEERGRSFGQKKCLQAFVSALGLLVGLALQACASDALAGLGPALPERAAEPLVRFALPPLLLLTVLPAWALYILPRCASPAPAKAPGPDAAAAPLQTPRPPQGGFLAGTGFQGWN